MTDYPYRLVDTSEMGLSADAVTLYKSMFRKGDGNIALRSDDTLWEDVYLDNARKDFPASGKRLSGLFSALEAKGLYRPLDDGYWGEVRIEESDATYVPRGGKVVETIDLTPTWSGLLPLFLTAMEIGTDDAKSAARTELERMAKLADAYVESMREAK
jgi:hypothetical protein